MPKTVAADECGQALIELILAIAIASLFLTTFVLGFIGVREALNLSANSVAAKLLIQKETEALRSIKENAWNSFSVPGTYHIVQNGNSWIVASGTTQDNNLTRSFTVQNICRTTAGGLPVSCSTPGSASDPSTKQITVTVSWNAFGVESISSVFYLSRYFNNSTWVQTTQADFNSGTNVNTMVTNNNGGEVQLANTLTTSDYGNKFLVTSTGSVGNMTNSTMKTSLRFTAQSSKTVSAIRVYLNAEVGSSPSYRYGLQADSGGLPSGTYLGSGFLTATATGWQTVTLSSSVVITKGTVYHLVVQWFSGATSNSRYIALRQSSPLNGLYPLNNQADGAANTLFNNGTTWSVQNAQPIYELDFSDGTYEGNPYYVQAEISIAGNTFVGEKFKVGASSLTATQISFYVRRNGTPPTDLTADLWNADTNALVAEVTQTTTLIPTTYAYLTYNFASPQTLSANTNYRVYLKSAGSSSANGYRINVLNATNSANYNSITYDGTNSIYTTSTNAGSTWNDTNLNMDIDGYKFTIQTVGMATSGTFVSQTFDPGSGVGYNFVTMTTGVPSGTSLQLQVATNSDNATWNFEGPDGTGATYFNPSGSINLNQSGARYLRFKAFLGGNGVLSPVLNDVTVNYSP